MSLTLWRRFCLGLSLFWGLGLVSGCLGYRVGTTTPIASGISSIQVLPVKNETHEPRLNEYVARALRSEIQRDGSFQLDTKGDTRLVLEVSLVEYTRDVLSFVPGDTLTTRDTRLRLAANVVARDRFSGETYFDDVLEARMPIRIGSDLAAAERQAGPMMAESMARLVVGMLADGVW